MGWIASTATAPHPTTAIHAVRRRQLVDAAILEIAEAGFEEASTVRIARRAGVSRGVLTHHFAGRDELIDAVVAEVYELGREVVGPAVAAAATPRDSVLAFVGASVDLYAAHPEHMAALSEIVVAHRRGAAGESRARHSREIKDVAALLREGQRGGELRNFDPVRIALVIRSILDGALRLVRAGTDPKELRDELVATVDAAIRKDRP